MGKLAITPKARRFAEENGLDLNFASGTGEYGSIRYCDVKDMKKKVKATRVAEKMAAYYELELSGVAAPSGVVTKEDVQKCLHVAQITPLSVKRQAIANNIMQSLANSAQYTLFAELDTTNLLACFARRREELGAREGLRLTFTDLLIYAVSRALLKTPKLNSSLMGNQVYSYNYVNLSLAVHCEDGLLAPVIRGTNAMSLSQIASARERIVHRTKNRLLTNDELEGGTFTLSNLGNSCVTHFTPIINYPQSAILGVGKTEKRPVVVGDTIEIRSVTYFSLTLDHMLIDGRDGDRFFVELDKVLKEKPEYFRLV